MLIRAKDHCRRRSTYDFVLVQASEDGFTVLTYGIRKKISLCLLSAARGDTLAALAAGIVDATPLDMAYIQRTEKVGFNNLLYLCDVANLRLGGFAVNTDKIQRNPEQSNESSGLR
jgi:hypothetical protein